MPNKTSDRVAFSPGEFAALFGKSQTWGYRQIYAGKVKAVTEYGRTLIPALEVERILGGAKEYTMRRPKAAAKKVDPWKRYIEARRTKTRDSAGRQQQRREPNLGSPAKGKGRNAALSRLTSKPAP